jgi:hypothetical protein
MDTKEMEMSAPDELELRFEELFEALDQLEQRIGEMLEPTTFSG